MSHLDTFYQIFSLIFLAEFGDKSQLVGMTLAARYRSTPVLLGTIAAFAVLNILAVLFGSLIGHLIADWVVYLLVGGLFFWFGYQALRGEPEEESVDPKVGTQLLVSVFILIFLAELGDKTQLALAAFATVNSPMIVWLAGTAALVCTTALGVLLGRALLQKISIVWVHKGAGALFILFSAMAFWQFYKSVS